MSISPICTVADGGGSPQSTLDGVDVTSGDTITIQLASTAGVGPWALTCTDTDETNVPATITAALTIDPLNKRATFTAPAVGSALRFQSVANNGQNADNKIDASLTTTFGVFVKTANGNRVGFTNETYESNHLYGWLVKFNQMLRAAPSGTGVATYTIDAGSAAIAKGQNVCLAPGGLTVTLATSAALTAAGSALGVATTAGTAGQSIIVAVESMVANSVTALGAGTAGPVRVNTTTGYLQRVTSFSVGDYPVGYCNTAGDVTMVRGIIVGVGPTGSAGGALGGTYPNPTISLAGNSGITGALPRVNQAGQSVRAVSTTYTVDASGHDDIIEASTSGGAFTLTLPDPTVHTLPIDIYGDFATNNLTVARHGSENIGGLAASYVCAANSGHYRFTSDGTNWLLSGTPSLATQSFASSGTFTPKAGVKILDSVELLGGGGGGGGGGRPANGTSTTTQASGGGGGGSALGATYRAVACTPGTGITVTLGTGGALGAGATANNSTGSSANDGTDTSFGSLLGVGAQGGLGGPASVTTIGALGGASTRGAPRPPSGVTSVFGGPGFGGSSTATGVSQSGWPTPKNITQAAGGALGATSTGLGGAGGAGGGSSDVAVGGAGGAGGAGSSTTASAGTNGTAAATANSGAGGGGGGGGGNGATASANGGSGAAGENGGCTVRWYEP